MYLYICIFVIFDIANMYRFWKILKNGPNISDTALNSIYNSPKDRNITTELYKNDEVFVIYKVSSSGSIISFLIEDVYIDFSIGSNWKIPKSISKAEERKKVWLCTLDKGNSTNSSVLWIWLEVDQFI
jgi:hypothetical protein